MLKKRDQMDGPYERQDSGELFIIDFDSDDEDDIEHKIGGMESNEDTEGIENGKEQSQMFETGEITVSAAEKKGNQLKEDVKVAVQPQDEKLPEVKRMDHPGHEKT